MVHELTVRRENGEEDRVCLCAECAPTTSDFLTVVSRRPSAARCDRCGSGRRYHFTPTRSVAWPACEDCGAEVPLPDIRAYQAEAGSRSLLPRCCARCAEAV